MTTVTAHASRRSGQRQVSAREIALTLRHPDKTGRHPTGSIVHSRGDCCVVTDRSGRTVITVYRSA